MEGKLRAYFYFTKNERIGILSLCVISFCLLFVPRFLQQSGFAATTITNEEETKVYNQTRSIIEKKENAGKKQRKQFEMNANSFSGKLDVNAASMKELKAIGISPKTAAIMVKYRDRGGQFASIASLHKIYGISTREIEILEKFGVFPDKENTRSTTHLTPVTFDPNTVAAEELAGMGLPQGIVQTMMNFREKGGKFYKSEDLGKIYGMKQEWLESLLPFVQIQINDNPRTKFESSKFERKNFAINSQPININTAGKEELMKIRGIGPYFADKIIKYRDALGGFVNVQQLTQVRGLPDSLYQVVAGMVQVSSNDYKKLKINELDRETLAKHPYISFQQALIIYNYRIQHGNFKNPDDIRKSKAFNESEMKNIEAYLDFSE